IGLFHGATLIREFAGPCMIMVQPFFKYASHRMGVVRSTFAIDPLGRRQTEGSGQPVGSGVMALKLNLNDLQFVLHQIKIAEAHANGIPLTEIRLYDVNGEVVTNPNDPVYTDPALRAVAPLAIPDPKTPFGLR